MHQTESLLSGLNSRNPQNNIHPFSSIFILPPEILSIILEEMGDYPVQSFVRLILTSKSFRIPLLSAVPYVRMLNVSHDKILWRFTGVKHLTVDDNCVRLSSFSKNIWRNLESLIIPSDICSELYESGCLESYLNQQPLDTLKYSESQQPEILKSPECERQLGSRQSLEYSNLTFFMPRLRSLDIYNTDCESDDLIKVNKDVMPNLRIIRTANCNFSNLSEFEDLDEIELRYSSGVRTNVLNNLSIRKLILVGECCSINWLALNIPSLRSLVLEDMNIIFAMLNNLKIEELFLVNSRLSSRLLEYSKMNNLLRLIMTDGKLIQDTVNINDESFPVLKYLRIERSKNINISASSLVDIRIVECSDIVVSEQLVKFVKILQQSD